ncbi:MAG: hypothetical protein IJT04_04335 [Bacteroidales bacterium]|nr:hypothetical protein [Bacteroidales bacterium]
METGNSLEILNNSCKNAICQNIREALSSPNPVQIPNIDKRSELFDPIEDLLATFQKEFKSAGGKCITFEIDRQKMEDKEYARNSISSIYKYVKKEIEIGKYNTVLNTSAKLTRVLHAFEIQTVDSMPTGVPADAAIAYAEFLVARTGHIVLSQRKDQMLYPSINNLAKNLIILSSNSSIVPDLKHLLTGLTYEEQDVANNSGQEDFQFDMLELMRPQKLTDEDYTPCCQHITLILIIEK